MQSRAGALWRTALTVFLIAPSGSLRGQAGEFDALLTRWQGSAAGSPLEVALEDSIRAHVRRFFGDRVIEQFAIYARAPAGSTEETLALAEVHDSASAAEIPSDLAERMLAAYLRFDSGDLGNGVGTGMPGELSGELATVDLSLESTRPNALAASLVGIVGTITNHSNGPVWIVDRYTTLLPPPEIWGSGGTGALGAFFPSIPGVPTDEIVRLDPQKSYRVIWTLNPRKPLNNPRDTTNVSLFNWLEFQPGLYPFSAQIHVWSVRPEIGPNNNVSNLSASQILSSATRLEIGLPIRILIVGGTFGGILAFAWRLLGRIQNSDRPRRGWLVFSVTGMIAAMLVAVVGTILVSRLGSIDSFISLSINDVWGAAATGFVIERIGIGPLMERVNA